MEGQTDVAMLSALLRDAQNERDRLRAEIERLREELDALEVGYNAQVGHGRKHWLRAEAAEAKVARVEALHVQTPTSHGPDFCKGCSEVAQEWVKWPCPTAAALAEGTLASPTSQTTGGGRSDAPAEPRAEATGPSVTFHDFAGSLGACAAYLRELADSETVLPANHGGRLWARWLAEQIETQTELRAESGDYVEISHSEIFRPPVSECSACSRGTWDEALCGQACLMTQPDGSRCPGSFRAAEGDGRG